MLSTTLMLAKSVCLPGGWCGCQQTVLGIFLQDVFCFAMPAWDLLISDFDYFTPKRRADSKQCKGGSQRLSSVVDEIQLTQLGFGIGERLDVPSGPGG